MNNSVDFYDAATDHVEYEVGFDDENPVSISRKFFMFGHPTKIRVGRESADPFAQLFREGDRPGRAIACDPVIDKEQVILGNRKVADRVLI